MASEMKPLGTVTNAWNTRPAPARCDELETTSSINGTLLVTRQNAEEVIAAKDARIEELEGHFAEMTRSCLAERDRNKALEADNKRLWEALNYYASASPISYDMGHTARVALSGKERQETGNE